MSIEPSKRTSIGSMLLGYARISKGDDQNNPFASERPLGSGLHEAV